jgi:hypothetical protein
MRIGRLRMRGPAPYCSELFLGFALVHQLRDDPALLAWLQRERELLLGLGGRGHLAITGARSTK